MPGKKVKKEKQKAGKEKLPVGSVISEAGNSVKNKTGSWRSFKPVLDKSKCTKCKVCWQYCPDNSIKILADGSVEIDLDYCKGCGICANECKVKAIVMELEKK
jgi:2-oxoacid:acceptor oxidoreductase delta subunit (pyruvate/2-ketoisovalerate family)